MSKLLSDWVQFAKKRRKLISVFLSIIIVVPTVGLGIYYQNQKNQITSQINQIEFNVTRFTIISSGEDYVITKGFAKIDNLSDSFDLNSITISKLEFEVFFKKVSIASSTIFISNSAFTEGVEFEIKIPVTPGNPSMETTEVLVNILLAKQFEMEFVGTLHYTYHGFQDSINIENKIRFVLDQKGLMLQLTYFDLQSDAIDSDIRFNVYNPLNISLQIEGGVNVVLEDEILGKINVTKRVFPSGWSQVEEYFLPSLEKDIIMKKYVENLNNSVELDTNFILGLGELIFSMETALNLSPTPLDIDFNEINFHTINLDTSDNNIDILGSLNLTSYLPLDINISSFQSNVYIGNDMIGKINWYGPYTMLYSNKSVKISNIRGNLSINPYTIAILASNVTYTLKDITIIFAVNNKITNATIPQLIVK